MDLFLAWKLNTVLDWLPQLNTELVSLCLDLWAVGRMHYMCQFGLQPPHTQFLYLWSQRPVGTSECLLNDRVCGTCFKIFFFKKKSIIRQY